MKTKLSMILLAALLVGCGRNYSNGSRAGIVTKLSKKGIVFDSWEGEMLMALPPDAGTIQPEKFEFNVAAEAVPKVKEAMKTGKRVELIYRQWWIHPPTVDSQYVITDVQ